jgi:hypothetical protein
MKGGFFLQQDPGEFDCSFFNLSADVAAVRSSTPTRSESGHG